jgi:hypothetical protein
MKQNLLATLAAIALVGGATGSLAQQSQSRDAQKPQETAPQQRDQTTQRQGTQTTQQPDQAGSQVQQPAAGQTATIKIDAQQQARISERIERLNVAPLTDANFTVRVGATVPASVRLQPLPRDIVEFVPAYRGHRFVVVRDQIVIVDPSNPRIVAVLPHQKQAAARQQPAAAQRDRQAHAQPEFIPNLSFPAWRASKLIGAGVYGPDDRSIGEINEIIVEQGGDVRYVVIGVGGFLGIGEKNVAVAADSLTIKSKDDGIDRIRVTYTKQQLEQAPAFKYEMVSAGDRTAPMAGAGQRADRSAPTTTESDRRAAGGRTQMGTDPLPRATDRTTDRNAGDQAMAKADQRLTLSAEQRKTVYQLMIKEKQKSQPPADVQVRVGAKLPHTVELYDVPNDVTVTQVKQYKYTIWNDQVVLVDPSTRTVVEVIRGS